MGELMLDGSFWDAIVVAGSTGQGSHEKAYVQVWRKLPKPVYGREHECAASMFDGHLTVWPECPDGWLDQVWDLFRAHRAGAPIEVTHRIVWTFGHAEFQAVA